MMTTFQLLNLIEELEAGLRSLQQQNNIVSVAFCMSEQIMHQNVFSFVVGIITGFEISLWVIWATFSKRPGSVVSQAFFMDLIWSILSVSLFTSTLSGLVWSVVTRSV